MTNDADTVEQFALQRGRLLTIAHRILGSHADAEDAVQETWLRFSRQDPASIDNPAAWLTTVVGRICIDMLRARAVRAEVPFGDDPSDIVVVDDAETPEDTAVLADLVGIALLSILSSLGPEERLAFVLHDMFAVPFVDIAAIVGKSEAATKMAASRARRKVHVAPTTPSALHEQRAVVDAFMRAARDGDFDALLDVLAPDVRWEQQSARGVTVTVGATEVADAVRRGARAKVTTRRVLINGTPGIAAWSTTGRPLGIMVCTVTNGRLTAITSISDPARLAALDLPEP
ncbi:RNA polymerase sigma-70 factor (ECF subfamily) [Mycolicibacterium sp. BK556]|uniref:sigma-70 family RNA polymerase sigma factor n=1 Tax=Mycobacteriaceae TaxID=1762 RepID=UPI00105FCE3D|nr:MULTISPECIES: sigma-70 family RNA polymerase sigma factor [Mycobacteriaceae]MBB3604756.1 RNA polymerase sigma-70 factor (ECF subfamily) [Mycolicibacterium sp. BK556]MBB3634531.1 RNA polymerase sigma-70 factor (ECF subfamily) [Mycolicibacterium sp. BK607]TDO17645.1 RNA polymerase sigma-70 factor (ECF subfamily) [Mycobacterium sp. BK086]